MSGGYTPAPGSVAFRALAYLETLSPGAELLTSALAEALGTEGRNISPCMEPALAAGLVFRRQRDTHMRSPFWWSLVDHGRAPKIDIRKPAVPVAVRASIPEARDSQQVLKATAARPDATARETPAIASPGGGPMGAVQPAAAGHAGLRIALWSDGTLQVQRGSADLVLFTREEVEQLVDYLIDPASAVRVGAA